MNKVIKIFLIIIIFIIVVIILDSIQARLFKRSPIISIRETNLLDEDSYVDKGIIINTYYCIKEKDIVKVEWYFKKTKFDCPVE